jgi:hypothetical protein
VNEKMRIHHNKTGLPIPVIVPVGIAALVAASLFYVEARGELQEVPVGVDGVRPASTFVDPAAVPAALTPPACATCPSRANCLPSPGAATPAALPPACATCPSRANCLPSPGAATPAALPPCATPSPFVQAAYPCVRR